MVANREYPVCFGKVGSKFDRVLAEANSVTRPFDSATETFHFEQTLRIRSKLVYDLLGGLEGSVALTTEIKIRRNLRDDTGKQFVGDGNVGFVDRTQELLHA